jgi:hypothetical protein
MFWTAHHTKPDKKSMQVITVPDKTRGFPGFDPPGLLSLKDSPALCYAPPASFLRACGASSNSQEIWSKSTPIQLFSGRFSLL